MTDTRGKVVFTGTSEWWQIVSRNEITTDEGCWNVDSEVAANLAELNLEDAECWVARVTDVSERHSAIKVGDYVCCQGIGSDVVFVRLN